MDDVLNLPNSWVQVTASDLGKVVSGGTPSTKENSYWGGNISWISPSDLTGYSNKHISKGAKSITQEGLKNSSATIMPAGSIHFSSRAPIGYTIISSCDMTTNQGFKSLVPAQGVFNEYIYYYFKSAKQLAESKATGTTFKEISGAAFCKLPVPLPPTNEQHRIVAKIEELFSELDKGIENLQTARAQLKVYRQALLKHAFEGKLTAQWRAENRGKLETAAALLKRIQQERAQRYQQQLADWEKSKSPSVPLLQRGKTASAAISSIPPLKKGGRGDLKPKPSKPLPPLTTEELAELPGLPEGWGWFKLADLSDISGGLTKNQKRNTLLIRRPFLRVGNVYANRLELGDMHDTGISEAEIERVTLVKGDILVVEGNGSVDQIGRVAIWNGAIDGCVHQNHLIKARPLNLACSEFILYFLMSELGRKFIVRAASSTSGLHTLSISKVESLFVPLCAKEEQGILLSELSSKLSLADQLDQTITTSLQQAEALRQSILKKAFSGQLVPQDPHDEPASMLLARIQVERAVVAKNAPTAAKPRKSRKV